VGTGWVGVLAILPAAVYLAVSSRRAFDFWAAAMLAGGGLFLLGAGQLSQLPSGDPRRRRLFALLLAVLVALGVGAVALTRDYARYSHRRSDRLSDLVTVANSEGRQRRFFVGEVGVLLGRGAFEELDAQARQLRETKARFTDGSWKLYAFYEAFSPENVKENTGKLDAVLSATHQWVEKRPDSVSARVALARALVDEAWRIRGDGYASSVQDRSWELIAERAQQAAEILSISRGRPETYPEWSECRMRLAFLQPMDRSEYDQLFDAAIAVEPDYYGFYSSRAHYLLPRWNGNDGEWEADLASRTVRRPAIYARTVAAMHDSFTNVFKESRVSWPVVKQGYEEQLKAYPESLQLRSAFCFMSILADDRAQAARLFDTIGPRVDLTIWRSREKFLDGWIWAHPGP
jgi:hypothetical protein